ncbi:AT-rich interactive domain-containing protein 5A isoform X2 [Hypomesus transpacificus]|uniref:AT-rich interactive domain-containing protein 5A isoform X2 n=1 Tax=Hypomesus transpacificus TaxID=137520 RepID=UPI001F073D05|nr:AT-rich interactive domain-containing protein 5A isoform X2 [Hypomesus transpacificus]
MVMEPEKKHSESSQQSTVREEDGSIDLPLDQTVMEIPVSTSNRDAQSSSSPGKTDERSFIASLNCFMKDRGTPIERIPHLGFKQINLWRIYKAVEKLGGYDSVTARRLWKSVYDELGGSPGSTSAATCTRRHYERLVLPFERERRGEEDKPLPQSKPRKQYKRGLEGKGCKSDGKRKSTQLEKDTDSPAVSQVQSRPEATQCQSGAYVPSFAGCSKPNKDGDDHSHTLYTPHPQLVSTPAAFSWSSHGPSTPGEVISPLEKKKRMAQASLGLSPGCREEEAKDRPSVIHCSPSSGLQPSVHSCNSSEGSPLPRSSCSSRCSSPYSVSSEDGAAQPADKTLHLRPESPHAYPAGHLPASSPGGVPTPQSGFSGKDVPDSSSPRRNAPLTGSLPADAVPIKSQSKPPVWSPVRNMTSGLPAPYMVLPTPSAYAVIKVPSASASGFTKVPHKSVEPLRPIPFQPAYRHLQNPNRSMQHDGTLTYAKRIHVAPPPLYVAERKERSRTMLPKPQPSQQAVFHPTSGIPVSYLVPAYDRAARDLRHPQGFHPVFLPGNMRLPQAQPGPVYHRHVTMGPNQSAPYDPAHYHPYPSPVWNIQTGYRLHGANPHYSHTRL